MRGILLSLAFVAGIGVLAPESNILSTITSSTVAAAAVEQQPDPQLNVDVDIDESGGAWYANPVWLAVGGLAIVILLVIVVMAARGGGTTVIKD